MVAGAIYSPWLMDPWGGVVQNLPGATGGDVCIAAIAGIAFQRGQLSLAIGRQRKQASRDDFRRVAGLPGATADQQGRRGVGRHDQYAGRGGVTGRTADAGGDGLQCAGLAAAQDGGIAGLVDARLRGSGFRGLAPGDGGVGIPGHRGGENDRCLAGRGQNEARIHIDGVAGHDHDRTGPAVAAIAGSKAGRDGFRHRCAAQCRPVRRLIDGAAVGAGPDAAGDIDARCVPDRPGDSTCAVGLQREGAGGAGRHGCLPWQQRLAGRRGSQLAEQGHVAGNGNITELQRAAVREQLIVECEPGDTGKIDRIGRMKNLRHEAAERGQQFIGLFAAPVPGFQQCTYAGQIDGNIPLIERQMECDRVFWRNGNRKVAVRIKNRIEGFLAVAVSPRAAAVQPDNTGFIVVPLLIQAGQIRHQGKTRAILWRIGKIE